MLDDQWRSQVIGNHTYWSAGPFGTFSVVRWATLNDASNDRYGFHDGRLVGQVAYYDGPRWRRAYVGGEPVSGYWASRDEAERAAESAYGPG